MPKKKKGKPSVTIGTENKKMVEESKADKAVKLKTKELTLSEFINEVDPADWKSDEVRYIVAYLAEKAGARQITE
jgi:hypothetical protein